MALADPNSLDALALLELSSVARGYRVLDWMVKEAPVHIEQANLVEPGKFLILFGGGVAEVKAAYDHGLAASGAFVVDKLLLPFAHPRIWACLRGDESAGVVDCLGVVEGRSVASTLEAADRSAKDADVQLRAFRLTPALGGKAYYVVEGAQNAVEAAVEAGRSILEPRGLLVDAQVIPGAHPEFLPFVLNQAPFGGR